MGKTRSKESNVFNDCANFEADDEIDNTHIGNKTNTVYKQNPELNGYYIVSELSNVLKVGYYESPLGYNNVNWFVEKVLKIENEMVF